MRFHLHVTVLAAAVAVALVSAVGAASATPLSSKQARASELDRQVARIESRYDHLQERYRGAQYELQQIQDDVREARVVVAATRRNLRVASTRLADRASAIYRSGGTTNQVVDIASGGTLSSFFAKLDTVRRVGDQDADVLERVETLKVKVERKERVLKSAEARASRALAEANEAKSKMGEALAERQAKLDSVNVEIRSIMAAQRRAAEARAAAAARASAARIRVGGGAASSAGGDSSAPVPESGSDSGASGGGSSIPLPPGSSTAAAAANAAMGKLGSPYVWAGSGPETFDCSGLVVWSFAQAGRSGLPHSTYALVGMGVDVPLDQLQVGDLVFPSHNGHVGIYIGGGSFVHAPSSGDVVKVTSMSNYSISHARRI